MFQGKNTEYSQLGKDEGRNVVVIIHRISNEECKVDTCANHGDATSLNSVDDESVEQVFCSRPGSP